MERYEITSICHGSGGSPKPEPVNASETLSKVHGGQIVIVEGAPTSV